MSCSAVSASTSSYLLEMRGLEELYSEAIVLVNRFKDNAFDSSVDGISNLSNAEKFLCSQIQAHANCVASHKEIIVVVRVVEEFRLLCSSFWRQATIHNGYSPSRKFFYISLHGANA